MSSQDTRHCRRCCSVSVMRHIEVKRRMAEADIAEVSELLQAAASADGHRPLGEHKWLDLVEGGRAGFAGFVARDTNRSGVLVGYAQLTRGPGSWAIERVVHPDSRTPDGSVAIDLVNAALAEVASQGGGHVHLWVPKPGETDDLIAKQARMSQGRVLYQMRAPLPVSSPASNITTRAFEPGVDEDAWLQVNNAAFAQHPEQGSWTLDTLLRREAEPWFDPAGFLVYSEHGSIAGSCWTKVHADEQPPVGEIYVISVDPSHQGKGLGRQLLLAGLEYLTTAGVETAMLYVDSHNTRALSLYEAIGFSLDHIDRAWTADVPPVNLARHSGQGF